MRFFTQYLSRVGSKVFNELLPAALVSGAVGLGFSHVYQPAPQPAAQPAVAASADLIQMVRDEHDLVLDYVRREEERQRVAGTTLQLRGSVVTESAAPAERLSEASLRSAAARKAERKLATSEPKVTNDMIAQRSAGEPLVLTNYSTQPPPKKDGILTSTANEIVSVVKKVPDWTRSAADAVLDLPGRVIPALPYAPERNFIKVSM